MKLRFDGLLVSSLAFSSWSQLEVRGAKSVLCECIDK